MPITNEQIDQLLVAIHPSRVLHSQGQSHVSQQDVRAHLTRIFGFLNWKKEILVDERVYEEHTPPQKQGDRDKWSACYRVRMRLYVRGQGDPWDEAWCGDDGATGASYNQPKRGDAHDNAYKNAISYALKRATIDLGDQFGLSLYNGGQTAPLVGRTMVRPDGPAVSGEDVGRDVPQQVAIGDEGSEQVDTSTGEVTRPPAATTLNVPEDLARLRAEINAVMESREWSFADLGTDYTRWAQGQGRKRKMLAAADVDDLTAYKAHLASSKVHANGVSA